MDIDIVDPAFGRLVEPRPPLDCIAHGLTFGEGPVWDRRSGQLFFVDIIGNRIWKYRSGVGREIVIEPSGHANGMTLDREGRLVVAGCCSNFVLTSGWARIAATSRCTFATSSRGVAAGMCRDAKSCASNPGNI